jgi:hypothetical protein
VIWNVAVFAGAYGLFTLKPDAMNFDGLNIDFTTAGWPDYANAVFGITHPPIAFQFWFVRDLLLSSLLSPVWWVLIRFAPWLGAAALGTAWIGSTDLVIFLRPDIPFFFYMGALVRQKRLPIALPLRTTRLLAGLYVLLACVRPLAPYVIEPTSATAPLWLVLATNTMRLVGVLGFWGMICRLAATPWGSAIGSYGGLAFFLHAAHWPLLALVKTALWPLMPTETDAWMLVHYITSAVLTIGMGLAAGLLLASRAPRLFALMNGGRRFGQSVTPVLRPLATRPQES